LRFTTHTEFYALKKKFIITSLLPFLLLSFTLQAQINRLRTGGSSSEESEESTSQQADKDQSSLSPDTARIQYYTLNYQAAYHLRNFSSSLHRFQYFRPDQNRADFYNNLGNAGSASNLLTFRLAPIQGFRLREDAYQVHQYKLDSIRFFSLENPYSEIQYMMGKAKEQQLRFTLSQQVRKGLTLGLHARFANAPGLYLRQRTYYSTGYVTLSYLHPSERYAVHAAYLNDRYRNYENGGILYDTVFSDNSESNRKTITVRLNNAINREKDAGIVLQHYFTLSKKANALKDSTGQKQTKKFDAGRLTHTFKYNRQTSAYQDDKSKTGINLGFYPATYGDSVLTLDSLYQVHIENTFVYSNIEPDTAERSFPFQYAFGVSHLTNRIGYENIQFLANRLTSLTWFKTDEFTGQTGISKTYSQIVPFGTLKGIIARKTFFIANGRLHLGGYNNGDYELTGRFHQFIGTKGSTGNIYLTAKKGLRHPDYFFQTYYSNHFRWDQDLKMQDIISAEAGVSFRGLHLDLNLTRISNYAYLDEMMRPVQADKGLAITRANASWLARPGRWTIDTRVTWQEVSRDSVLLLPLLTGQLSVSYTMLLFKKVLLAETGISCLYHSSYYADAYSPALRMFYRQNVEMTGNYPYLDVFVNMRIKRARIFVKYEHFNAGLMGYTYFKTPHYPGADAALKAGVAWVFYD